MMSAIPVDPTMQTIDEMRESWKAITCEFLILRILRSEHADLRSEIRKLRTLAAESAQHHGPEHPKLKVIGELVEHLAEELTSHMAAEENTVFPALLEIELAYVGDSAQWVDPCRLDSILRSMSEQHREAGRMLGYLRRESNNLQPSVWADTQYEQFRDHLCKLDNEFRRGIQLENAVLFRRAAQMEAELSRPCLSAGLARV